MLLSFVKRDRFELAFWLLCSVHAVKQVSPDVLGSRDGRYRPFAACTVDATVCHVPTSSPDNDTLSHPLVSTESCHSILLLIAQTPNCQDFQQAATQPRDSCR